ncbi:VOC family protein [Erwiniaceae bacterium BAC15a-03b]|uniref:2-oxoadipate dioxygenase/decarboxylase n=1 Tax=Winslowiella arboricola TaxID=2978220 RepID=A0A9J6PS75_9GAMM|nr:VOC family protein [Winslowiella arboricola]MCU5775592.1 VOC family protein [Winslowiella arboricola]MCU5779558.1 VOC family protein [Winslowiella arboricola]
MDAHWVSTDSIREDFSQAMSAMYQQEVPQYGTLLRLVAEVNQQVLTQDPQLAQRLAQADELDRISVERHGAIRVGTAAELNMLRQLFAIMGMYPVGYYDLSQAGVPVHSTAFRPVDDAALRRNPFRLFTSLLRLELIDDVALRQQASEILAARDIFTPRCRQLVELQQQQGGFTAGQAEEFVSEALETFRWHQQTTVDSATWQALSQQHRLVADVVCFPGCHINHLTPRTLDIDRVQALMPQQGITPKAIIEGPPQRQVPILLRQTSFKALDEAVRFRDGQQGTHTARFGEIEQRGVALTRKGRELYDRLLTQAGSGADNQQHQQHLATVFSAFPDDEATLRQQQLAWFEYRRSAQGQDHLITPASDIEQLIAAGVLAAEPIIYEDFLPVSAAGIFQSNLGSETHARSQGHASREQFEQALGTAVRDEIELYAQREQASRQRCGLL